MSEPKEKEVYFAAARFKERPFQPYALAIGQAALAWNSLQEEFGNLFWTLMGDKWLGKPMAIWQALKVDRSKRDILGGTVENMPKQFYEKFPQAKAEIAWLIKQTNSLEDYRNNAIHAPLQLLAPLSAFKSLLDAQTTGKQKRVIPTGATVVPQDWLLNQRAKRMAGKHILDEYRWCHATAIVLRDYAIDINWALQKPNAPWPDRPRLPNRGRTSGK